MVVLLFFAFLFSVSFFFSLEKFIHMGSAISEQF